MIEFLFRRFIVWAVRRVGYWHRQRIVSFATLGDRRGILGFYRYAFLWPDEWIAPVDGPYAGKVFHRPPWWRPFNAFVHCWRPAPGYAEEMHDHPRWTITLCLRGRLIERTPWSTRELRSGSIVIRSRKYIHGFVVPPEYRGKTWTLFIVGRRNHRQNTYVVTPR